MVCSHVRNGLCKVQELHHMAFSAQVIDAKEICVRATEVTYPGTLYFQQAAIRARGVDEMLVMKIKREVERALGVPEQDDRRCQETTQTIKLAEREDSRGIWTASSYQGRCVRLVLGRECKIIRPGRRLLHASTSTQPDKLAIRNLIRAIPMC